MKLSVSERPCQTALSLTHESSDIRALKSRQAHAFLQNMTNMKEFLEFVFKKHPWSYTSDATLELCYANNDNARSLLRTILLSRRTVVIQKCQMK